MISNLKKKFYSFLLIFTIRNEVFSQACVKNSVHRREGVSASVHAGIHPPGQTPPGRHPLGRQPPGQTPYLADTPHADTPWADNQPGSHCSGWYISYWNAFLLPATTKLWLR